MLAKMWKNWKPCALLVVMYNGAVAVEKSGGRKAGGLDPSPGAWESSSEDEESHLPALGVKVHVDCKGGTGEALNWCPLTLPTAFLSSTLAWRLCFLSRLQL